ncbi:MAG: tubulin-like doman-containing protein [Candidatus Omnitrophica bacterium]|nr:tubulin-like doman-containing protein [Candidatus Omnitrophota bacterium]
MAVIVIGAGGIGTGIIRRLYQKAYKIKELRDRMSGNNPTIFFVQLDIDTEYERDIDADLRSPANFYVERPQKEVEAALKEDDIFREWWIPSYKPPTQPLKGSLAAGQIRINGRLCFYCNLTSVKELLTDLIQRTQTIETATDENPLKICVVSSLGGGTGSGMFIDLGFLIRKICEEKSVTNYILIGYCLDGTITKSVGRATEIYAYATLTEIDFWMRNYSQYRFRGKGSTDEIKSREAPYDFIYLIQEQTRNGKRFVGGSETKLNQYKNFVAECLLLMLEGERKEEEGTVTDRFYVANELKTLIQLGIPGLKWAGIGLGSITFPLDEINDFILSKYLFDEWERGAPLEKGTLPQLEEKIKEWKIAESHNAGLFSYLGGVINRFPMLKSDIIEDIKQKLSKKTDKSSILNQYDLLGDLSNSKWTENMQECKERCERELSDYYTKILNIIKNEIVNNASLLRFEETVKWINDMIKEINENKKAIQKGKPGNTSNEIKKEIEKIRTSILNPPMFDLFGRKQRQAIGKFIDTLASWRNTLLKENLFPLIEKFYNDLEKDLESIKNALERIKFIYTEVLNEFNKKATLPPVEFLQAFRTQNNEYPLKIKLGYTEANIIERVYKPVKERIKSREAALIHDLETKTGISEMIDRILTNYTEKVNRRQKIAEADRLIGNLKDKLTEFISSSIKGMIENETSFTMDDGLDWYFDEWRDLIKSYKQKSQEKKAELKNTLRDLFGNEADFLWENADSGNKEEWNSRALRGILSFLNDAVEPFMVIDEEREQTLVRRGFTQDIIQRLRIKSVWYPEKSKYGGIISQYASQNGWHAEGVPSSTSITFLNQIGGVELKYLSLLESCREEYLKNISSFRSEQKVASVAPIHADKRFYKEFYTDILSRIEKKDIVILILALGWDLVMRDKRKWYAIHPHTKEKMFIGNSLPKAFNEFNKSRDILSLYREHLNSKIGELSNNAKKNLNNVMQEMEQILKNKCLDTWQKAKPPEHVPGYELWELGKNKLEEYIMKLNPVDISNLLTQIACDISEITP